MKNVTNSKAKFISLFFFKRAGFLSLSAVWESHLLDILLRMTFL